MAKQLVWKKTVAEAITAKGTLNENSTTLTYLDEDKNECTINVQDLLDKFASQSVSIAIKCQSDEELDLEEAEEVDIEDLQ